MSKQRDTKLLTNITIDPNRFKPEKNRRYVDNKRGEDALDKVVRDMANVFYNLKNGIFLVQSAQLNKKESINNIESELETIYKKQEEINRLKEKELKEKKQVQNTKKHQKKINSSVNNTNNQNESNQFAKGQIKASSNGNNAKNQPTTPNSSSLNKSNQGQIINVKNLRFPPENTQNINAKTVAVNPGNNLNRQNSSGNPSLRKPQQNANKVVSVPQPREIYNPLGILKDEVDRAIKDKKTFTIKGNFSAVRKALLKRGWVEKYHPIFRNRLNDDIKRYQNFSVQELVDLLRNKDLADTIKKMIKSKLLSDHQVDLYWDHNYDAFKECSDKKKLTIINRFRRGSLSYTSKQGLCQAAREAHWLHIPGIAQINHPRCYVLAKGGDTKTFLQDFGLTAAISLLKWVVKNNITEECKVVSETGKIPMKCFDFAIAECYKYLKKEQHQDIDEHIKDAMEIEWNAFLDQFYKAVHVGNHFKLKDKTVNPSQEAKDMVRQANYLLNQLREYRPCMDMDGYMNIWILKPINSSRGLGIHICRTLQVILDIIKDNPNRRYVIQKYIERPLLIHETKFDIRQWFLVTCSYPLTIWIYKICYLRFSSQTYNLRKLHESIHLTNNSVQAKYLKVGNMDPLLARHGMWDSNQFKVYRPT